jgi:hypothetical protein
MWTFKSRIPEIQNIKLDNDGNTVTIIHSDGAYYYNEQDVLHKQWTNNFFCHFNINHQSNWQIFIFWHWVIAFSFGLFYSLVVGPEYVDNSPMEPKMGLIGFFGHGVFVIQNGILYLSLLLVVSYFSTRLIYYFLYRDFFSKDLIQISLKSNQILFLSCKKIAHNKVSEKIFRNEKDIFRNENDDRIFDRERKNETTLAREYAFAIALLSVCFYSIYSNWGENRLTSSNSIFPMTIYMENAEKKKIQDPTYIDTVELNKLQEYLIWYDKNENKQIPKSCFFSLGYFFGLVIGIFVVLLIKL